MPPLMPGGESTSARLRRVEQERDDALAAQARLSDRLTESAIRLAAYRQGRDLLRAELVSARQELYAARADVKRLRGELRQAADNAQLLRSDRERLLAATTTHPTEGDTDA